MPDGDGVQRDLGTIVANIENLSKMIDELRQSLKQDFVSNPLCLAHMKLVNEKLEENKKELEEHQKWHKEERSYLFSKISLILATVSVLVALVALIFKFR